MKRLSFNINFNLLLILSLSACSRAVPVKAAKAVRTSVESTVTTTSSGTVDAQQQAVLGFSTTGRVSRMTVKVGDAVKKGQVLASLEASDLQTIFANALGELKRSDELFRSSLISRVGLEEARRNLDVAQANLDRSQIKAPFDGIVTEVNLEVGELAQNSTTSTQPKPPLRVVDLKPRLIRGNIDEMDLGKVKVGTAARVRIPAVRPNPFEARVTRVIPYVNTTREQDRTAQIELTLNENPAATIPVGASADIEIIVAAKPQALAVPSRTLLGGVDHRYLFRAVEGRAVKTELQTGIGNYDRTEITQGVSEGDLVIFPPDDRELQDGMKVSPDVRPWP